MLPRPKQDANKFLTKYIGKYDANWLAYFRRGVLGLTEGALCLFCKLRY